MGNIVGLGAAGPLVEATQSVVQLYKGEWRPPLLDPGT